MRPVLSLSVVLMCIGCTGRERGTDEPGCSCQGDVPGGVLSVACGETQCVGGFGYLCTGMNAASSAPEACFEGDGGTGMPVDAGPAGDAGPPPLESIYEIVPTDTAETRYRPGLSCDTLCGERGGTCDDSLAGSCEVVYISRAFYSREISGGRTDEAYHNLGCDGGVQLPYVTGEGSVFRAEYDSFLELDCCCHIPVPQTQWLANDVEDPVSCDELCESRGLTCGTHDQCEDVPALCSDSFPEFNVQSIARYSGVVDSSRGLESYPECDDTPSTSSYNDGQELRLRSHRCVCK